MNEPSKRRTYWRYHCSVTYVTLTLKKLSREIIIDCYVTNDTEQR